MTKLSPQHVSVPCTTLNRASNHAVACALSSQHHHVIFVAVPTPTSDVVALAAIAVSALVTTYAAVLGVTGRHQSQMNAIRRKHLRRCGEDLITATAALVSLTLNTAPEVATLRRVDRLLLMEGHDDVREAIARFRVAYQEFQDARAVAGGWPSSSDLDFGLMGQDDPAKKAAWSAWKSLDVAHRDIAITLRKALTGLERVRLRWKDTPLRRVLRSVGTRHNASSRRRGTTCE